MKAFLLAAGLGTRLRPSPTTCPSASSGWGPPLLDLWLDNFRAAGVDEVLVNLHHLPEQVGRTWPRTAGGPRVRTSYEPDLLGSAGTLVAGREFVGLGRGVPRRQRRRPHRLRPAPAA